MKLVELETFLKTVKFRNEDSTIVRGGWFDVEYETDEDYFSFSFNYDFKKNRFECCVSIYHASEDNNCENQEAHTEEKEYYDDNLSDLVKEIADEFGYDFTKAFNNDLSKAVI